MEQIWANLGYIIAFALGVLGGHFLWPKIVKSIED